MNLFAGKQNIEFLRWYIFYRKNIQNNDLFFGLHIHKTAGMTLLEQVKNQLPPNKYYINSMYAINFKEGIKELEERTTEELNSIRFIFGHNINEYMLDLFKEKNIKLFTFLRDPIARAISWYFYYKRLMKRCQKEIQPFNNFYSSFYPQHSMCEMLTKSFPSFIDSRNAPLYEQALSVLKKFYFVSTLEDFSSKAPMLFREIGIRHLKNEKVNATDYTTEQLFENEVDYDFLQKDNKNDIQLYKEVKEIQKACKRNNLGFDKSGYSASMEKALSKKHLPPYATLLRSYAGPIKDNYKLENIYDSVLKRYRDDFDNVSQINTHDHIILLIKLFALEEDLERKKHYRDKLIGLNCGIQRILDELIRKPA